MPSIHGPLHCERCGEDRSRGRAVTLQQRVPGAEGVVMERTAHACNAEKPWAFDAALPGFVGRRGLLGLASAARGEAAGA